MTWGGVTVRRFLLTAVWLTLCVMWLPSHCDPGVVERNPSSQESIAQEAGSGHHPQVCAFYLILLYLRLQMILSALPLSNVLLLKLKWLEDIWRIWTDVVLYLIKKLFSNPHCIMYIHITSGLCEWLCIVTSYGFRSWPIRCLCKLWQSYRRWHFLENSRFFSTRIL